MNAPERLKTLSDRRRLEIIESLVDHSTAWPRAPTSWVPNLMYYHLSERQQPELLESYHLLLPCHPPADKLTISRSVY